MPAVVGRIEDGRLLLDLRAVDPADDELLAQAGALLAARELSAMQRQSASPPVTSITASRR